MDSIAAVTAKHAIADKYCQRPALGTPVDRVFRIVRREVFEGPWAIPQFVEYATRNNK